MSLLKATRIHSYEIGLRFINDEFVGILEQGAYRRYNPFKRERIEVIDRRGIWLRHRDIDAIIATGALQGRAGVLNLQDRQRALVWIDGRFACILQPGTYYYWTGQKPVRVEIVEVDSRFTHRELQTILKSAGVENALEIFEVENGHTGLFYLNGVYQESLTPGVYAFWKGAGKVKLYHYDLREMVLDIGGQDIITADKVTLRLNAVLTYRLRDVLRSVNASEDFKQALYRIAQLALRAVVGTRELTALLEQKDGVIQELREMIAARATEIGVEVMDAGIRDVILPGEMKELLNKVTEAKAAAEANLITRREETAAMRSQANTAKLLENNPILLRLRELETLEKVAANGKLSVILGEQGLREKLVNLV